jgi:2-alkenal reductase
MQRIERTIRVLITTVLAIAVLALGGLAVTGTATHGGASALVGGASTAVQKVAVAGAPATVANTGQSTTTTAAQAAPAQQQSGIVDARYAVRTTGPAVVTIINTMQVQTRRGRFGGGGTQTAQASGSGIIIDNKGDIVTNQHVIDSQQSLQVIFADGTQADATLVGSDTGADIAVIRVSGKVPAIAQFGDSSKLEIGQPVIAIGSALGNYTNTVTQGILSGVHRQLSDVSPSTPATQDMLQTDAAINHGDSGGPLLDLNGNVIGINTAVISVDSTGQVAEGLGFAIPINTVKTVIAQWVN